MFTKAYDDYIKGVYAGFITLFDSLIIKKKFESGTRQWCTKCATNIKKELKNNILNKGV